MDQAEGQGNGGAQKVIKETMIVNKNGIHARPAAKIVQTALPFESEVYIARADAPQKQVVAKSLLGLLTLYGSRGTRIRITGVGPDAEAAVDAQVGLFASGFGEM